MKLETLPSLFSSPLLLYNSVTTTSANDMRLPRNKSPIRHRAASLYIHTTEPGSGKAMVSLGVLDLILKRTNGTARVGFFRPIIGKGKQPDEDTVLMLEHFGLNQTLEESYGMRTDRANELLGQHCHDEVIEEIISKYKALEKRFDFILCEGRHGSAVEFNLNLEMAKNLACPIVIVASAHRRTIQQTIESIQISMEAFSSYGADIVGIVLNKAAPQDIQPLENELNRRYKDKGLIHTVIPYEPNLTVPRISDIVDALKGEVLYGKRFLNNRVSCSILGTMQLQNVLNWIRKNDCLMVTSGDRADIIVGALQAHRKLQNVSSSSCCYHIDD